LAGLITQESRVKFARYKLTGVIDENSKYAIGKSNIKFISGEYPCIHGSQRRQLI